MKFATVDGRTAWVDVPLGDLAGFRGDVCDVLDVCPTYIFTHMGRVVTNVGDVSGEVVVVADPNVSLLAQEVCSAVNCDGAPPHFLR
jgi:type 1 glutamine amidotransferase